MTDKVNTRRGLTLYEENPFVQKTIVQSKTRRITNKKGDLMVISQETNEVVAEVAGFWHAQEVDDAKFVKLYINGMKVFKELTSAGTRVFEVLYLEVQKAIGQDKIYISFSLVDQNSNPMSPSTYDRGIRELIMKGFLAPTKMVGWFWLNHDYIWNGDRLAFVKAYYKASSKRRLTLAPPEGKESKNSSGEPRGGDKALSVDTVADYANQKGEPK